MRARNHIYCDAEMDIMLNSGCGLFDEIKIEGDNLQAGNKQVQNFPMQEE